MQKLEWKKSNNNKNHLVISEMKEKQRIKVETNLYAVLKINLYYSFYFFIFLFIHISSWVPFVFFFFLLLFRVILLKLTEMRQKKKYLLFVSVTCSFIGILFSLLSILKQTGRNTLVSTHWTVCGMHYALATKIFYVNIFHVLHKWKKLKTDKEKICDEK